MAGRRENRPRRWRRRLVRGVAVVAGIALLATGACMTGIPQERVIVYGIERALGGHAEIAYTGLVGAVRVDRLALYATKADRDAGAPVVEAHDIRIDYQLLPPDGRYLRAVRIGRLTVAADEGGGRDPNYRYLLGEGDTPMPEGALAYVPRRVVVETLSGSYRRDDARAEFAGIRVESEITDLETIATTVRSPTATVRWWLEDPSNLHELSDVRIDARVAVDGGRIDWSETIRWADRIALSSAGSVEAAESDWVISLDRAEGMVDGTDLQRLASPMRTGVAAAALYLDVASGMYRVGADSGYELDTALRVMTPRLAGAKTPLYDGAVAVAVTARQGDDVTEAHGTATFAREQRIRFTGRVQGESGTAKVETGDWSKADLLDAIPASFRDTLRPLGFDAFDATVAGEWNAETFEVSARAESASETAAVPAISWTLDATGPTGGGRPIEGHLDARLGTRLVQAAGHYTEDDGYRGDIAIEEVEIRPWLAFFLGDEAVADVKGTIEGAVTVSADALDAPLAIAPEVTLNGAGYGDTTLDHVTVSGGAQYVPESAGVRVDSLRAAVVDGATTVELADWTYATREGRGEGRFRVDADATVVGKLVGLPDLAGSFTVDGSATATPDEWSGSLNLFSDFLGYGDVLLPYGEEVTGAGTFSYGVADGTARIQRLDARVGEGTTARIEKVRVWGDPLVAEGALRVQSDLALLVAMGYCAEAVGAFREETTFRYDDDGWYFNFDADLQVERVLLSDAAGFAEGLSVTGVGTYENGLDGRGEASARLVSAAGGSLHHVRGPVVFEGSTMRIERARGTIFDGVIDADLKIGLFESGLPVFLRSEFRDVDLQTLTAEVQPPNTELTGIAHGTLTGEMRDGEVAGFELDARSDTNLSVNRSLVADLLTREGFLAGMGERLADRTLDKILGDMKQRPFESGWLYVYLAAEELSGTVELRSGQTDDYRGLNLNVNLDVDAASLADALLLLEQARLESMEF